MKYSDDRARAHAELAEILPQLCRRLAVAIPYEVEGLGKVTPEQFAVLVLLKERGPLSMSEIAIARKVALNTATSLVGRLVDGSLAERSGHPADRRIVKVGATLKGRALVERLRRARHDAMRRLLEELSDHDLQRILSAMPVLGRLAGRSAARA